MSAEIDKWILDHAYAPDDIVLGDGVTSISDEWLTDLQTLLDLARPGWRDPLHGEPAVTTRDIVVAGALPRHQVRQYLKALGVEWVERQPGTPRSAAWFTITGATEAQWGQIQEWVRKVTG